MAEQVKREVADLLMHDVKDPRARFVSLTGVDITPDYAHAKVFFTLLPGVGEPDDLQRVLNRAAGFLRVQLGRRLRIHTIPELHFFHDTSVARGVALSSLIDEAVSRRSSDEDGAA